MTTRMFHISDVHFGVENRSALAIVEQAVREERPDALICTGDLTQRAKHSEYAAAAQWFGGLGVPVVLEPGNHDMPYYNPIERFTDPYRRYRRLAEKVSGPQIKVLTSTSVATLRATNHRASQTTRAGSGSSKVSAWGTLTDSASHTATPMLNNAIFRNHSLERRSTSVMQSEMHLRKPLGNFTKLESPSICNSTPMPYMAPSRRGRI